MDTTAQRLDALMDHRRLDLGLRWKAVTERAAITHQTLLQLRKGAEVSDLTIARVERALEWEPGSIRAIRAGGDPITAEAAPDAGPLTASVDVWWDEEIVGPTEVLYQGEILRWRDEANTLGEPMRTFQMEMDSVQHEASLGAGTAPEDAAPRLRAALADRVMLMTQMLMGRPQHRAD